jgi:hypothetical protein
MARQCSSAAELRRCGALSIPRGGAAYDDAQRNRRSEARMTSRREVLKAGLAASTLLPLGARADSVAVDAALAQTVQFYKVLYDARFAAGVAFARRAAARGLAVHAMAGDMTRFWYDDLYHRWRQGPVAIAGLTAHGALFCLERLAWEHRMRVVYRVEHAAARADAASLSQPLFSWVIAPIARAWR